MADSYNIAQKGIRRYQPAEWVGYYPFGMVMGSRSFSVKGKYRYGFNGKESDAELSAGEVAFEYRIFDARIAKFFSLDPRQGEYPWQTPYAYYSNSPIAQVDYLGMGKTSRHLDPDGKIICDIDDGDKSIYKHQTARTEADVVKWRSHFKNTSGNGVKVGELAYVMNPSTMDVRNAAVNIEQFNNTIRPVPTYDKVKLSGAAANTLCDITKSTKSTISLINNKNQLRPQFYKNGWGGNQYRATSSVGKILGNTGKGLGYFGYGTALYDISTGEADALTYVDAGVGTVALASDIGLILGYEEIPVVGQIIGIYGCGRLCYDLGKYYGPSTWYGTDDTKWFR